MRTYRATLITATDDPQILSEGLTFNDTCERVYLTVAGYKYDHPDTPQPVVEFWADGQARAWLLDNVVTAGVKGEPQPPVAAALAEIEEARTSE